jgi:hypothetical protein
MTGYHTRWICRREQPQDQERIAICEALAFGKAVYDQPRALGLSVAGLPDWLRLYDSITLSDTGGADENAHTPADRRGA